MSLYTYIHICKCPIKIKLNMSMLIMRTKKKSWARFTLLLFLRHPSHHLQKKTKAKQARRILAKCLCLSFMITLRVAWHLLRRIGLNDRQIVYYMHMRHTYLPDYWCLHLFVMCRREMDIAAPKAMLDLVHITAYMHMYIFSNWMIHICMYINTHFHRYSCSHNNSST